jgi:hypothetical protein
MMLTIKTMIQVNDKDPMRCSRACKHIAKERGNYVCKLFGDTNVDTGEDDEIGYGFARVSECITSVIGQPHVGSFAGDF